jgi:hypothetical protein
LASAVSDDAGDAADHDVDLGAATTAIPRHDVEARTTNETSDGMDTRDTVEEEKEEEEEEEDSTDPKLRARRRPRLEPKRLPPQSRRIPSTAAWRMT